MWVPVISHRWTVASSLEARISRPESETPTLVKLELGVGGLYCAISCHPVKHIYLTRYQYISRDCLPDHGTEVAVLLLTV